MLKFHPYSILTGDTMVGFVILCVLRSVGTAWKLEAYFSIVLNSFLLLSLPRNQCAHRNGFQFRHQLCLENTVFIRREFTILWKKEENESTYIPTYKIEASIALHFYLRAVGALQGKAHSWAHLNLDLLQKELDTIMGSCWAHLSKNHSDGPTSGPERQ